MKTQIGIGALVLLLGSAKGQETVAEFRWGEMAQKPSGGEAVQVDGRAAWTIENTKDAPLRVNLLNIENPKITSSRYALVGEVKYEGVEGDAYLETWNHFPEGAGEGEAKKGGKYFSRTLGDEGPLAKLKGTSAWRDFILPFNASGGAGEPNKIEFNIYLPGKGSVQVGPVRLIEYKDGNAGAGMMGNAWWSERSAGLVGGIGGAVFGCFAGLLAFLASKGKARGFVMGGSFVMLGFGLVCAVGAVVALVQRQPYGVWFPLTVFAVLVMLIVPFRLKDFRRSYEHLEMRRIASLDT